MPRLAGYRVLAVDMVGFGRSAKPGPSSGYAYSQDDRDAHLAAFIEAASPRRRVVLVGNSMGGLTALGVARKQPSLLSHLVLMGSAGLPVPPSDALRTIMEYDFTREGMARIVDALTAPGFEAPPGMVEYRHELSIEPATRAAYGSITAWNKARGGTASARGAFHRHPHTDAGRGRQARPRGAAGVCLPLPRTHPQFDRLHPAGLRPLADDRAGAGVRSRARQLHPAHAREGGDMSARYVVHKLAWDLWQQPGLRAEHAINEAAVYSRYGLTDAESALMRQGSFPALAELGMHPLVQMPYSLIKSPEFIGFVDASDYLSDLDKERS